MNKKIRIFILILILIFLILILRSTFSKYTNSASAEITKDLGKWVIKINQTDITPVDSTDVTEKEFTIDTFNWLNSQHVIDGKVAPGMEGYFELEIDPTDTDVSFEYEIFIDKASINIDDPTISVDDIIFNITSVSEINGKALDIEENEDGLKIAKRVKPLSEIQSLVDVTRKDTIQVNIEWENNEDNNEMDSKIASIEDTKITFPIRVRAIQYTGI